MLQRGNPYGMHSHAGAWERESGKRQKCKLLLDINEGCHKFNDVYEQAGQTRAALREFINCFRKYEKCKVVNREL